MYSFYLDGELMPIAPEKLNIKINNNNKTMNLINDGEINILKKAGLTDISFELLLPNVQYPFAKYMSGFKPAKYYLDKIEALKVGNKPFQFIVSRELPRGPKLQSTNIKVSIEDYQINEDAENGFDCRISVKLKQYKDYSTKKITIISENKAKVEQPRPAETSPAPVTAQTYTVKSGDCLWNIAKQYYGNGSLYNKIFDANRDKIKNPNLIYPGQVLTIPS